MGDFMSRYQSHVVTHESCTGSDGVTTVAPSPWPMLYYDDLINFIKTTNSVQWTNEFFMPLSSRDGTSIIEFGVGWGGFGRAVMEDADLASSGYTYIGVDLFDAAACDSYAFKRDVALIADTNDIQTQLYQVRMHVNDVLTSFLNGSFAFRARLVVANTAAAGLATELSTDSVLLPGQPLTREYPLIFIDGGHSYSQVVNDIISALNIIYLTTAKKGTLVFDDYFSADYTDVQAAIDEFVANASTSGMFLHTSLVSGVSGLLQTLVCSSGHKLVYVFVDSIGGP
jgi:hypothetical protein